MVKQISQAELDDITGGGRRVTRREAELERALDVVARLIDADDRRAAHEEASLQAMQVVVATVQAIGAKQEQVANELRAAAQQVAALASKMNDTAAALSRPRPRPAMPEIEVRYDATGNITSMGPANNVEH